DALKKKCMICCISSGGTMLKFAKKIEIPSVRVPRGIPPRAALPYLFIPMLSVLEKTGQAPSITGDLSEAKDVLSRISAYNLPKRPTKDNFSKTLAWNINESVPAVFGFGIYRGVAQRFKQQFNENSKIPSTWGYLPELDHNEIVGWEDKEKLQLFSQIFIRDAAESAEIRSRIESTKALMPADSKVFEVWSQGESELTKMLSALSIGDFTSVYLAVLRKVDPTPVETIQLLKNRIKRTGTKEKIVRELEKTATK
ncbi:hypothetical protein KAI12_05300, partial [Candidatus Bathyarchaeota archaeon]|nr:hypothetical protein [Candidatus Bathyarchaeota archaeon]